MNSVCFSHSWLLFELVEKHFHSLAEKVEEEEEELENFLFEQGNKQTLVKNENVRLSQESNKRRDSDSKRLFQSQFLLMANSDGRFF